MDITVSPSHIKRSESESSQENAACLNKIIQSRFSPWTNEVSLRITEVCST